MLQQVFDLPSHGMSPALAESILSLDFPESAKTRTAELNTKANEGTLTPEESAELEAYIDINDLLAYWQSEARQQLRRTE
jgi:hypothetical protein